MAVYKEWSELTDRWKRHLIRESVRLAVIRSRSSTDSAYEDFDHGLLVQRMARTTNQWLVKTPGGELWQAAVSRRGKITVWVTEYTE